MFANHDPLAKDVEPANRRDPHADRYTQTKKDSGSGRRSRWGRHDRHENKHARDSPPGRTDRERLPGPQRRIENPRGQHHDAVRDQPCGERRRDRANAADPRAIDRHKKLIDGESRTPKRSPTHGCECHDRLDGSKRQRRKLCPITECPQLGKLGKHARHNGDEENRVGQEVHGLTVLEQRKGARSTRANGEGKNQGGRQLLGADGCHTRAGKSQGTRTHASGEGELGRIHKPRSQRGKHYAYRHRDNPESCPPPEGSFREIRERSRRHAHGDREGIEAVRCHDDETRDERCERWPEKLASRLQVRAKDDRNRIERQLKGENPHEASAKIDRCGIGGLRTGSKNGSSECGGKRPQHECEDEREQNAPREQR